MGTFCCYEVTIGFNGKERVDYLTYDTKGIWRCYEIKVSKSDFYSKAKKTFVGHYNYFVLTRDLYNEVKSDIPSDIGVYVGQTCVKKPKKRSLGVSEKILKDSMIRSLYRDASKLRKLKNPSYIEQTETTIRNLEREKYDWQRKYNELIAIGYEKYGVGWYRK